MSETSGEPNAQSLPADPDAATMRNDVVTLTRDLICIDTSNPGDDSGPGEIEAAEYVAAALADVGIEAEIYTTTSSKRAGVMATIPGTDPGAEPLLLTGHLDVVPAEAADWTHPPFAGVIDDDGVLWGRGAVDMKNMVAMILAAARHWARSGTRPRRPVVLLFTPDEEAGGHHGAHWIVKNRPDLLGGATDAIGEVGGFSVTLPNGSRIYPVQAGEKGLAWITATVSGTAGHGSLLHEDNPVEAVVRAVATLADHRFPVSLTPAMAELVRVLGELVGEPLDLTDQHELRRQVGSLYRVLGAGVRTTINPTMLQAGYKHNIVPARASAGLDLRFLPGEQDSALATVAAAFPEDTEFSYPNLDIALETPFTGALPELFASALLRRDPDAHVVPFIMTGGTDGKAFSTLGVRYFGFSPLQLPDDTEFWSMFHAADERVPVSALQFGVEVLEEVARLA